MAKTRHVTTTEIGNPERFMGRCLELAAKGAGFVAPNPMVGAVLVHNGRIIGEGYHEKFGSAHAEPNCINQAIKSGHENKLAEATLYVSLEPCAHFGKTPPCADLIIRYKIPEVVIGCRDPFPEVNGKGIETLKAAGVEVRTGVAEEACKNLNRRFFCFHRNHRPYIILKWAMTADKFIAPLNQNGSERWHISNEYSNRLVHQWRSEEAAILVGTRTALLDNPTLTTRLWPGKSPVRVVVDLDQKLPHELLLFDQTVPTIVFNTKIHQEEKNLLYYQLSNDTEIVYQVMNALYRMNLQSVLIEGGAKLLQSFIDNELWDEARVITNKRLKTGKGLPAPVLSNEKKIADETILTDTIEIFYRNE